MVLLYCINIPILKHYYYFLTSKSYYSEIHSKINILNVRFKFY